jgi:hypothetical protein
MSGSERNSTRYAHNGRWGRCEKPELLAMPQSAPEADSNPAPTLILAGQPYLRSVIKLGAGFAPREFQIANSGPADSSHLL